MEEVLLFLSTLVDPLYVAIWCFGCMLFTALTPAKVTAKVPDFLMQVINLSALNVGNAANKYCDLKGNPCDEDSPRDSHSNKKTT